MQVTSKHGQWLGDIAVREAGSIEAMVELAIRNDISITDKMIVGSLFSRPTAADRRVMNYYNINNIYPATSMDVNERSFNGIGYMAVEITFLVS